MIALVKFAEVITVEIVHQLKTAQRTLIMEVDIGVLKAGGVVILPYVVVMAIVKVDFGVGKTLFVITLADKIANVHLDMFVIVAHVIAVIVQLIQIVLLGNFAQITIVPVALKTVIVPLHMVNFIFAVRVAHVETIQQLAQEMLIVRLGGGVGKIHIVILVVL